MNSVLSDSERDAILSGVNREYTPVPGAAKVLIVDDALFMRMMYTDILNKAGYTVAGDASDGNLALSMYKELKPDVVLLNIVMREVHGIDALRQITGYDPNARVVIVSAMDTVSTVFDAFSSGATDFVVKPFEVDRLLAAVRMALESDRRWYDVRTLRSLFNEYPDKTEQVSQEKINLIRDESLISKEG